MPLDRSLLAQLRTLDRHDLRRALIFVRGLLLASGEEVEGLDVPAVEGESSRVTYRRESVRCGKPNCKSCPHGPYWYAYYREGDKLRSRYVGRELPADAHAETSEEA